MALEGASDPESVWSPQWIRQAPYSDSKGIRESLGCSSPSQGFWTAGARGQETDSGLAMLKSWAGCPRALYAAPARHTLVQVSLAEMYPAKAWRQHAWIRGSSSLPVCMGL